MMDRVARHRRSSEDRRGRIRPRLVASLLLTALASSFIVAASSASSPSVPRDAPIARNAPDVIIDTDLSLYWDDATALGIANALQQQGKVRILGIMSDIRNPVAVAAIDAIDTAYGHRDIPVGAVSDSDANTAPRGYSNVVVARLPHTIRNSNDVPDAVSLYRRLLTRQPDHSVTVVLIGAYTNVAGLLLSPPGQGSDLSGRSLVAAKVKRLVIEDGLFPGGGPPLTNQKLDLSAARTVVSEPGWPTPISWVDGFTGVNTKVGGALCTSTPADNPMRIIYQSLFACGPPGDGDWDGPTMLFAIGGTQGIFSQLGQGGSAVIDSQGPDFPGQPDLLARVTSMFMWSTRKRSISE